MQPKFDMLAETKLILGEFLKTKPGDLITYDALKAMTGINDVNRLHSYANTARRHALKAPHSMAFATQRGLGWKRLDETGKVGDVSQRIRGVRRKIKGTTRVHTSIQLNAISTHDDRLKYAINNVQLTELKKSASKGRANRIGEKIKIEATTNSTDANVARAIAGALEKFKKEKRR